MSPLARLLLQKQSNGLSFKEMERNALGRGHRYSSSAFEQVAKDGRAGRLDLKALEAIAAGVGETVQEIARLDDARWGIQHTAASPSSENEDSLRYQRPEGLSDSEWERLKRETRDYIEFQLDRAARER